MCAKFCAKLQKKSEIRKFSGEILLMPNTISANGRNLRICFRRAERGYDEATESAIELVGRCAKKLGIGASDMFVRGFAVLEITVLPVGEAVGIGHLRLAEVDGLRESADSAFAALSKRSSIWIKDCVRVRATVAGTHDDTFFG